MNRTQHIAYFKVPYKQKDKNNDNFCCGNKKSSKGDGITDNEDPELNQFYYHSDHLGSSSYITNLSGNIVQHVEYVPFGEVFIEERNNKWNTPYLFNGKELDEETGLYYYGARYYSSRNSIFLSVDRFADKFPFQSPYCYASNNPITFIDINGDSTFIAQNGGVINVQRDDNGNFIDNIVMMQNNDGGYDKFCELGDKNIAISGIMENLLAKNSEEAKSINNLIEFGKAVETGSDWDLKNNKETVFGIAWEYDEGKEDKTTFKFNEYSDMTAADVGNYHFGYVGKFVKGGKGFTNYTLWKGAGWAEAVKEWSYGSKFKAILRYNSLLTPLNRRSGDRKADFKWSTNGMRDAKKKKN